MRIAEFPVTTNQLHGCRVRHSAPLGLQSRQSMLTTLDVLDICTLNQSKMHNMHVQINVLQSSDRITQVDMNECGGIFLTHILDGPTNGKGSSSSLQATRQTKVS